MTTRRLYPVLLTLAVGGCAMLTGAKAPARSTSKPATATVQHRPQLAAASCATRKTAKRSAELVLGPLCAPFLSPGVFMAHRAFREHAPDVLLAATVVVDAAGVELRGNRPHLLALGAYYLDHLDMRVLRSRLEGLAAEGVGAEATAKFIAATTLARAHVEKAASTDATVQTLVQALRDAAATRATYWKQHGPLTADLIAVEAEMASNVREDRRAVLIDRLTSLRAKYVAQCTSVACTSDRLPVAVSQLLFTLFLASGDQPAALAESRVLSGRAAEEASFGAELVAGLKAKVDGRWPERKDRNRLHLPDELDRGAPVLDRDSLRRAEISYPEIDSTITSVKAIPGNPTHRQLIVAPTQETVTTKYANECRKVWTQGEHGPELTEQCRTETYKRAKQHPPMLITNLEAASLAVGERVVAFVDPASRRASIAMVTSPLTKTQARNDVRVLQVRESRAQRR